MALPSKRKTKLEEKAHGCSERDIILVKDLIEKKRRREKMYTRKGCSTYKEKNNFPFVYPANKQKKTKNLDFLGEN